MKRLLTVVGLTVTLLTPAGSAFAFHHVPTLPDCGEGGATSTLHAVGPFVDGVATGPLASHPVHGLPLPPFGTPADTLDGTRADGARASAMCD